MISRFVASWGTVLAPVYEKAVSRPLSCRQPAKPIAGWMGCSHQLSPSARLRNNFLAASAGLPAPDQCPSGVNRELQLLVHPCLPVHHHVQPCDLDVWFNSTKPASIGCWPSAATSDERIVLESKPLNGIAWVVAAASIQACGREPHGHQC